MAQTQSAGQSLLSGVITRKTGFIAMPPATNLTECDIRQIDKWIGQGMLNN
ncbi:MAG: hypothetical protein HC906_00195 [Bacteroidales bacterium]|nr:hypothetical protein [Bacteroidales bacterium]